MSEGIQGLGIKSSRKNFAPPRESSRPRDQTRASHVSCSGTWILTAGATSVGAKSLQLSPTLCDTVDTRLLCPWDSPGQSTGVGSHILLQEDNSASPLFSWNFPLLHFSEVAILYPGLFPSL